MLLYENVSISYGDTPALSHFTLSVGAGEIVALVGESGSGKTSALRAATGLLPANGSITDGVISFDGQLLNDLSPKQWQHLRGSHISTIFQDFGAMLNPIRTVGSQFVEYIRTHKSMPKKEAHQLAADMLTRMGLPHSQTILQSYPFQLSGGMRQRVGIAMAMVFQPKLLLADEPTSALDVTTQAQIVQQMLDLRTNYGTSILLVTHNLGVAAYMADHILVMKNGRVVECGNRDTILQNAHDGYTKQLLDAVPDKGKRYV